MESDLEKTVERILPRDLPSDTREAAALADEAAKGIAELDPAFAPVLEEVDNAVKGIETAFDFLKSKIEKVKAAATVTTPAEDPTTPVVPTEDAPSSAPASSAPAVVPTFAPKK